MKYSTTIVITVILTIYQISFGQDFRQWLPENGVAVRQGHQIEWFRSSTTRETGENAGEVGIVWSDTRSGYRGIYSQVIDVEGNLKYGENGLLIAVNEGMMQDPVIWADPDGGWFYAWDDFTNDSLGDIYCTKINADGEHIWNDGNSVPVVEHEGMQGAPQIVHDGEGGCIIVWCDMRDDDPGDLFAMHILNDGRADPDWTEDGIAVVAERGRQLHHAVTVDGSGGMIVTWKDGREIGNTDIWAQRITPDGDILWGDGNAIPICNQEDMQETPKICSDGSGGAFICWVDERNARDTNKDIYIQRVNSDGELLWSDADEGIPLVTAIREQINNKIVASENGTAIVMWEDSRGNGQEYDIYAMSISGIDEMEKNWEPAQGKPIVVGDRNQTQVSIYPDGEGGIYAAWDDERDNPYPNLDIYAQRLDRDGEPMWERNGIPVNTDDGMQAMSIINRHAVGCATFYFNSINGGYSLYSSLLQPDGELIGDEHGTPILEGTSGNAIGPQIHSKGNGDFAVIWLDGRLGGLGERAYLQLFRDADDYPEVHLEENGMPISSEVDPGGVILVNSAMNEDGEIFVVWEDHRRGQPYGIYAQKISNAGEPMWESGIRVAEFDYDQNAPKVISDGQGGAIIAWRAPTDDDWYDIYMQRFSPDGEAVWGAEGLLVTGNEEDEVVVSLVSDGEGGAVVLWKSDNDDTDFDLLMNRVNADGELMWGNDHVVLVGEENKQQNPTLTQHPEGFFIAWRDNRNDDGDDIWAQFINNDGSARWLEGGVNICRAVLNQTNPKSAVDNEGNIWVVWEDNRSAGRPEGRDIYIQKLGIDPNDDENPTILLTDENGNPFQQGMPICSAFHTQSNPIIVHDGRNGMWVAWEDFRTIGIHSDLYATHLDATGNLFVGWDENGNVICDAYQKVQSINADLLNEDGDSGIVIVWEDKRASGKEEISNIYMQKIRDDFVSVPSDEASHAPHEFSLKQAYPNPFNSKIRISYGLPYTSHVSLIVYNLSGQVVGTLFDGNRTVGEYSTVLNADNLASGLYFVRLKAIDQVITQKIMLLK